ncbi:preprotein translocase subunit SecG [Pseudohoeflea coraliihabitans]|uniref:Protein-export membrane protein SecG n=1 Tax=Pseudohoeflea coraliihabitans TaxID=2860393 RepID=A0ABS6WS55_9HYPH|nr:preprotein translocase subunit SecG [Pseudohoeflea sp. DP4N28-3]MBW3098478.1 preprotein translocase subunit SecG [Pseudohoeflea sp. DP4N28-3]
MQTVLIVIHLMIVLALVGVVLIQRSEGGGLGIGGGSGFMSARGAANALTRTTAILAAAFFATSLALGILARYGPSSTDILDRIPTETQGTGGGILDQLGGGSDPDAAPANNAAVPSGNVPNAEVPTDVPTDAPANTGESPPAATLAPADSQNDPAGVPTGQ